ncbi:MAG: RNA methyltransferase [Chitinophagales bacterium]|nr:RNA methyltransferase [Chitinophagales bacterium]HAE12751.1 RNA methyltransferase [Bacteroidota bacterium]MCB9022708.1 RNA methyltransferase [Chitinophagales bacterium]HPE98175.1 RNA methyltransferase [Chitinophagales bacterium]HPR28941.1 RNA methyltransferase [Chitinophagales bacterium]
MHKTPNESLHRKSVSEFKDAEKTPIVVVLDNVRSLHNVGSVFRTCDAFLVRGICLCGVTAKPPHRDIEKTALGATESVHWEYFDETTEAIRYLRSLNYRIIAVEQTDSSISLEKYQPYANEKVALVFGHELYGVSEEVLALCDDCIEIPQFGTKHSLNISVSAGIVLWDLFSKLRFGVQIYTPAQPLKVVHGDHP